MEGKRMVVGPHNLRLDNDVGALYCVLTCQDICGKGKDVEHNSIPRDSLLCVINLYLSFALSCSRNSLGGAAVRQRYDYYLIIVTVLILFSIGIVCIYGISYYNYLAVSPEWTGTIQYTKYIDDMNSYLYPFLVLLLISLGLCIPKRLFEPDILMKFSALVLGITLILTFLYNIEIGLGFILAVMTGVQGLVLILTSRKAPIGAI